MKNRKAATAANVTVMLVQQAFEVGAPIECALCHDPIFPSHKTIREHMHALGLDGPDTPDNWRLVHRPCADRKTNGTKATTAGSDKNLMAKHRRLTGKNKPRRKRKIQSRGFDKTKTRRLDGTVVPATQGDSHADE